MGEPIPLGRACGLCGEQVVLAVETDSGTYTDDLTALVEANRGDTLLVTAQCDCPQPYTVALEATSLPADDRDRK